MKRSGSRTAVVIAVVGCSFGILATPALSSPTTTLSVAKRPEPCTAVRNRLTGAPRILTRIETNIDRLRAQLENVRVPGRRTALAARIERLEVLRSELNRKIADARRVCAIV